MAVFHPSLPSGGGKLRIPNNSRHPILIPKHEHFCQVRVTASEWSQRTSTTYHSSRLHTETDYTQPSSTDLQLDPDGPLTASQKDDFATVLLEYDEVLDSSFIGTTDTQCLSRVL